MQPENPNTPEPNEGTPQDVDNPLTAMQEGEQVICEIKRHPIGLIGNYIVFGLILIIVAIGAILGPQYASDSVRSQARVWGLAAFIFVAFFVFVAMWIVTKVYQGNRWIVTSDSITQISQLGIFNKQSSQLSLHNLEDITVEQNGILQSAFKFGTLRAETAGERSKFYFRFCPNPNDCAREILMAREKFMAGRGYEGKYNQGSDTPGVNVNA